MDPHGHIYELSTDELAVLDENQPVRIDETSLVALREDVARLDGYLRGRADSDRPKRGKGANKDLAG